MYCVYCVYVRMAVVMCISCIPVPPGILAKLIRKSESRETVLDQDCIKTIEGVLNYLPFFPLTPAEEFMEAIQVG